VASLRSSVGSLLAVALGSVLLFAGCARRGPHAQHWRVKADHPEALARWTAKNLPRMPEDLGREYLLALKLLEAETSRRTTPNAPLTRDPSDPLCVQVRGLTVRQIVLKGYATRIDAINRKVSLEHRNLAANIGRFDEASNVRTYERFIAKQRSVLAGYEEERLRVEEARTAFEEKYP
jgi:hypothetical protein